MGCFKSSVGNGACTPCGTGKYTDALSGDVLTTEGHTTESDCKDCQAGKYSEAMQNPMPSCIMCHLGKYQPLTGKSSCLSCPAGKTTADTGANAEADCIPGNVPQLNMTEPMEVPALEDVKFEASCAALRFDGSVKGETKVSDATKIEELLCFTSTLTLPYTTMCRFVQSQRGMP